MYRKVKGKKKWLPCNVMRGKKEKWKERKRKGDKREKGEGKRGIDEMKGFNCCLALLSRENKELKQRERERQRGSRIAAKYRLHAGIPPLVFLFLFYFLWFKQHYKLIIIILIFSSNLNSKSLNWFVKLDRVFQYFFKNYIISLCYFSLI